MRTISRTYYITAGIDATKHHDLGRELDKLGGSMVDCFARFNNKMNVTWLINSTDPTVETDILDIAKKFGQESVLIVHGDNHDAELVFTDGARKLLGKMVCLGPDEGKLRGRDYSYVNGNFYVVE